MSNIQTLGENRHRCFGCGSCCFGHAIGLLDDAEADRIREAGAKLGVPNPVVDGQLRFENERCVFHRDDMLCAIHAELGSEVKPLRCQLWPLKLVRSDDGLRFGIDPGCMNAWRTWRTGEAQEPAERMVVRPSATTPAEARMEESLLALARVDRATVPGLFTVLGGGRAIDAAQLPDGLGDRLLVRLRASRLSQLLAEPALGQAIGDTLAPVGAWLDAHEGPAPPLALGPEADAFAREVLRRKLWLREAPVSPAAQGLAVLTLTGAVLCGWVDPEPSVFGPRLSLWTRLMRHRALWLRFAPELALLKWVCTGVYDGALSPDVVVGARD